MMYMRCGRRRGFFISEDKDVDEGFTIIETKK